MRPNNNFHGHGSFQHNQGSLQHSYSDDNFIPFSHAASNQQYFQQQAPPQATQYDEDDFMTGDYQPEVGLYDETAFLKNPYLSSDGLIQEHTPQPLAMTTQGISRPALDPQAQKLKALVKKSQEQRAKSGTPPGLGSRQLRTTESTSSLRESPIHSGGSPDSPQDNLAKDSSTNEAVEALLSEVKAGANASKNNRTQNNPSSSKLQQSRTLESGKISQTSSSTTSTKSTPQDTSSRSGIEARKIVNQRHSNGGSSDMSEGEIREDKLRLSEQSSGPKEVHNLTKPNNRDEQVLNKKRDEQVGKSQRVESRGTSHGQSPSPSSKASVSRNRDEGAEERSERKNYHSTSKYEQSHEPEPEQKSHQRDLRDSNEDNRKRENSYERREEPSSRRLEVPTLAQLLEVDEDLRDWLNYTGYHKTEYRNKVLNRRRAIAALDAQKAKLLEEMELEERGGLQTADTSQTTTASMLPPPIPTKISAVSVPVKKTDDVADRGKSDYVSAASGKETGVKRTYTDYRGSRDEEPSEKTGRLDEQGRGVRIKTESQADNRRSHPSSAYEPSRRRSPSADSKAYRHEDRDKSTEERGRGRGRTYSQEREISPGLKAHESRPPARSKSYDFPEAEERDDRNGARPFIQVGNYRGRAYDPNYKYRGRGRGSWATSHNIEPRPQSGYSNQRIASMKPYRDSKPLDRGGRGATRYFIVKSFNEENVIRSIEDGIWTTQIQNGDLFKTAFLTCKNVILVYSINQSRAFQGYARMEGIPGSEEAPRWMNNINWESAGAFRVRWITVASTRFGRVGHLKNKLNENQAVLVAKDGQEVEEACGEQLTRIIDEEAELDLASWHSRNAWE